MNKYVALWEQPGGLKVPIQTKRDLFTFNLVQKQQILVSAGKSSGKKKQNVEKMMMQELENQRVFLRGLEFHKSSPAFVNALVI